MIVINEKIMKCLIIYNKTKMVFHLIIIKWQYYHKRKLQNVIYLGLVVSVNGFADM